MNKALLRVLCLVLMLTSALAFTLAFSSSTTSEAEPRAAAAQGAGTQVQTGLYSAVPQQEMTPTPEDGPVSHPGSTDGIVVMSITIVVIIVLPILLQRSLWRK